MKIKLRTLAVLSLLLLLMIPAGASADWLTPDGQWYAFNWSGGTGFTDNPTDFEINYWEPLTLKITDVALVGDAFKVYLNGVLALTTLPGSGGEPYTVDPDEAYASPDYSHGSINLAANTYYDITIYVYHLANDYNTGAQVTAGTGYISAEPSMVPIPAAVWLLGSGLFGLFGIRRKFRD